MKIKKISYPTTLEETVKDPLNGNIDVFVETEDGYHYTMTVGTPSWYYEYMDAYHMNYIIPSPPDVIVRELTAEIIQEALDAFCKDDGYWMKYQFLSGSREFVPLMNRLMDEYEEELRNDE